MATRDDSSAYRGNCTWCGRPIDHEAARAFRAETAAAIAADVAKEASRGQVGEEDQGVNRTVPDVCFVCGQGNDQAPAADH